LPVAVSDGECQRRVYDWAKFEDRETVWVRTRRGYELEGSVTHQVLLPDGTWRRLDEVQVGSRVVVGGGRNLWASEYVPINWQPPRRVTLADVAERVGVDIETVIRYRRGVRGRHSDRLAAAVAEYEAGLAELGAVSKRRRAISVPTVLNENL